jgi:hypothetical protein
VASIGPKMRPEMNGCSGLRFQPVDATPKL